MKRGSYFKFEIIREERKLPMVKLIRIYDNYDNNTFADLGESTEIGDMQQWCVENECGYRSSYDCFKFRNEEQMLLFLIRWA